MVDRPKKILFQSTLPVKGATLAVFIDVTNKKISIHAPREGSDATTLPIPIAKYKFQSTLPVKGATAMLTNFSVTIVQLSANSTNFSL